MSNRNVEDAVYLSMAEDAVSAMNMEEAASVDMDGSAVSAGSSAHPIHL